MESLEMTWTAESRQSGEVFLLIAVRGQHDRNQAHGGQMKRYISSLADDHNPVGIVIDLSQYEYTFGADLIDLLGVAYDSEGQWTRAICIVAKRATADSLKSLFGIGAVALDIEFAESSVEAETWMHELAMSRSA